LLFIQGLLNRKGMQNLGFGSAIGTAAAALGEDGNEIARKHLDFFNCNPNFTPIVLGGVLKLEEERIAGKPIDDKEIEYFKRAISSPLAAMGDMLFLGTLKPMALTFACLFAIYKSVIGLLAVFLLYNLVIVSCRLWGVYFGYARGWELVDVFSSPAFLRLLNTFQGIGAGAGGALIAIISYRFLNDGGRTATIAGVLAILTIFLIRKDVSATWFAIFLLLTSVLLSILTS